MLFNSLFCVIIGSRRRRRISRLTKQQRSKRKKNTFYLECLLSFVDDISCSILFNVFDVTAAKS